MGVRIDKTGHRQLPVPFNHSPGMRRIKPAASLNGAYAIAGNQNILAGQYRSDFALNLQRIDIAYQQIDHHSAPLRRQPRPWIITDVRHSICAKRYMK